MHLLRYNIIRHLDLRTADKILQTLQVEESGQSGLPSPATIISDKNYMMVTRESPFLHYNENWTLEPEGVVSLSGCQGNSSWYNYLIVGAALIEKYT